MAIIDDGDELSDGEETLSVVPDGFQRQMFPPPALGVSLVNVGVLVGPGLGWFGEVSTRKAQKKQNVLDYGCRVILDVDQSTCPV